MNASAPGTHGSSNPNRRFQPHGGLAHPGSCCRVPGGGRARLAGKGPLWTRSRRPPRTTHRSLSRSRPAAGIDHIYDGDFTYFVGGGVAVFDCNDDGRPDLYFAGGIRPAALYRNESPIGGELQFTLLPEPATDLNRVTGAYPLDIDSDGRVDLAVLRLGGNVLLRGLGDCRFERANEAWGFDGGDLWTVAFSAKWEGTAEWPTLAFGNYVALTEDGRRTNTCSDNVLLRPDPMLPGYANPIPLSPGWCTLSILFSDWDRSGRRDLRMTNDRHYYLGGEEQLWRVAEGEIPRLYTREEGWQTMRIWGMGIASYDLTGDGLPEVFLTSQGDNKLQTLADGADRAELRRHRARSGSQCPPSLHRRGHRACPPPPGTPSSRMSTTTATSISSSPKATSRRMPEFAQQDPSNLLLGQPDGTFIESAQAAGILSFARGRGAAMADFNLDGMLDLVEVNRRENVKLWRSVGSGDADRPAPIGNWISLQLEQTGPNRDAIGSWIEVRDRRTHR